MSINCRPKGVFSILQPHLCLWDILGSIRLSPPKMLKVVTCRGFFFSMALKGKVHSISLCLTSELFNSVWKFITWNAYIFHDPYPNLLFMFLLAGTYQKLKTLYRRCISQKTSENYKFSTPALVELICILILRNFVFQIDKIIKNTVNK